MPVTNVRPIGSSPGKCRRANVSLTMTTCGTRALSRSSKSRPARIGMPSVAEVPRRDEMTVRLRPFAQRRQRPAADRHRRRRLPAGQRHAVGERGRRAARQRRQTLIQLLVERDELVAVVALRRQRELRGEDAFGFESRLDRCSRAKLVSSKPAAIKQHERQRHFGDEQPGAQTLPGSDRSAARFLQRFLTFTPPPATRAAGRSPVR